MDFNLCNLNNVNILTTISLFQSVLLVFSNHAVPDPVSDFEILGDYNVYYSVNKTKEVLMKYYNRSNEIKRLVEEFDFRCAKSKLNFAKHFPFITVESAYRRTRSVVAQKVAKKVGGRMVGNPPQYMTLSNYFFNDTMELRRAFYSLGVYAASCRIKEFLATSTVVVAGYWIDQTAFGIAKMFETLPPETSPVYEWPKDLLRPDRVYLINTGSSLPPIPLHPYKPMRTYSFKDKLLEATGRFKNPSVTEISTTNDYDDIVRILVHLVNKHFNTSFPAK
ncbi:UMP-CMP kinase 2, mitochondrial-like [Homalodisca vitripennis]|uniref:UMP-CMP kinase 2, mitochondrial-like n=1 Tax=Homalodisca vitripennis TaxID=197043 RepID=UPI001EEC00B5|nr:UMP-CMP kinase 2, mitochondrial-like [Homalodisca vitripennis]KAG8279665.1 UMP kinase activity, variant 2 [Homalodisca vitripennis]